MRVRLENCYMKSEQPHFVICIKAESNDYDLTVGKLYKVQESTENGAGAFYVIDSDRHKRISKFRWKFKELPNTKAVRLLYNDEK